MSVFAFSRCLGALMQIVLFLAFSAALSPLVLLGATLIGWQLSRPQIAALLLFATSCAAALVGLDTVFSSAAVLPFTWQCFRVDRLAAIMLLLISSITMITLTYSHTYMEGDARRSDFICQIGLLASIMSVLVISGDVLLLTLCWCLTTPVLAVLTKHCKTSPAIASSSRLVKYHCVADACFFTAMILLAYTVGSTEIATICKGMSGFGSENVFATSVLQISAVLTVIAALIKSSVFPFHSWLFGTLDAPTPFSAFLHAGLINIAGFISFRLAPVIFSSAIAPGIFIVFGLVSALLAALCSLVQPDVKRKLVFSTIAQMGFMCLQCGLGAFSAALFHLVCHGFFKCYLFLDSGSGITASKSVQFKTDSKGTLYPALASLSLLTALILSGKTLPISLLSASILAVSILYECLRIKAEYSISLIDCSLRLAAPMLIFVALYAVASTMFSSAFSTVSESPMLSPVLVVFCGLMLITWTAINAREQTNRIKNWLYVFALNGGYLTHD